MLTLNSALILGSTNSDVPNDAYKSLVHLCVGNIILTVAGYLPGFGASFLLIDVWGRKPIQLMGFIVLSILFWSMCTSTSPLSRMTLECLDQALPTSISLICSWHSTASPISSKTSAQIPLPLSLPARSSPPATAPQHTASPPRAENSVR